jgi:hypothetical protein
LTTIKSIHAFLLIAGLSLVSIQTSWAECFFIRLNNYQLTERPDLFSWGEVTPLIALEAGRFYNLSPPGELTFPHDEDISGEIYYIPQHLIDSKKMFSLRMMTIERDIDTPDDLILPLREQSVSLKPQDFKSSNRSIKLWFSPFGDMAHAVPQNEQLYLFNVLKNNESCDIGTEKGLVNDQRYRRENELKRLALRVKYYKKPALIAGHEYAFFQRPKIEQYHYSDALRLARQAANINTRELLMLGHELRMLEDVISFDSVWNNYSDLIKRLYELSMTIRFTRDGSKQTISVPALGFHPRWKTLSGSIGIKPPDAWKVF